MTGEKPVEGDPRNRGDLVDAHVERVGERFRARRLIHRFFLGVRRVSEKVQGTAAAQGECIALLTGIVLFDAERRMRDWRFRV